MPEAMAYVKALAVVFANVQGRGGWAEDALEGSEGGLMPVVDALEAGWAGGPVGESSNVALGIFEGGNSPRRTCNLVAVVAVEASAGHASRPLAQPGVGEVGAADGHFGKPE